MMKTLFQVIMVAFLASVVNLYVQECNLVQDGNDMTVYYTSCLDEAFNDSPTGAVIYLTGGFYNESNNSRTFNNFVPNCTQSKSSGNNDQISLSGNSSQHFINYRDYTYFYSESHNIRVKDGSLCKNYGIDGSDLGIYGTDELFKDKGVPQNPQIEELFLAVKAIQGALKVKIKVEAQDR